MSWVVATEDISPLELNLGRNAVDGLRKRPDGSELRWRQLGVLETLEDSQLPFFVQWLTTDHPSLDGKATAHIQKIELSGDEEKIRTWLGASPKDLLKDVEVEFVNPDCLDGFTGISSVTFFTLQGEVSLQ